MEKFFTIPSFINTKRFYYFLHFFFLGWPRCIGRCGDDVVNERKNWSNHYFNDCGMAAGSGFGSNFKCGAEAEGIKVR